MKPKKAVLLFLALLFPACIFVFLKFFGKNEFGVPALYTDVYPEGVSECGVSISLPYRIPDSVQATLQLPKDSLSLIHFGEMTDGSDKQLNRIRSEHGKEIKFEFLQLSPSVLHMKKCIFFIKDPYDLVLVDGEGVIRGQYNASDRDEVDRLLTELTILLNKY